MFVKGNSRQERMWGSSTSLHNAEFEGQNEYYKHNLQLNQILNFLLLLDDQVHFDSTSPDPALVAYVKQLMTEYNLLQKDIAEELHIRSLPLSLSSFFLTFPFQLFSSFFEFNMNQSLKELIDLNRLRNILTFLLIYYS
jgi:antitoxin component HigA of HigAB toxin-antitoxin module